MNFKDVKVMGSLPNNVPSGSLAAFSLLSLRTSCCDLTQSKQLTEDHITISIHLDQMKGRLQNRLSEESSDRRNGKGAMKSRPGMV